LINAVICSGDECLLTCGRIPQAATIMFELADDDAFALYGNAHGVAPDDEPARFVRDGILASSAHIPKGANTTPAAM
jgi:hypothetical protein